MFKEERNGSIKGLWIARNVSTIHHFLFSRASVAEASSIKICLDKYYKWSGQLVNASKSSIHFTKNTKPTIYAAITRIIPYSSTSSSNLYLGLPFLMGNSKKVAFQSILDKVLSRIEGWRAKTLSQAGRLTFIKSVAAALPSYAMSSFLLPNSICIGLDRIFKNFWWGFSPKKVRNLSLKAWDSLCLPKSVGGLGLKRMKDVDLKTWLETSH
jgi:hypothetical protein